MKPVEATIFRGPKDFLFGGIVHLFVQKGNDTRTGNGMAIVAKDPKGNRHAEFEMPRAEAAKLHGDLTRILGLDTPTLEYVELTLLEILTALHEKTPIRFSAPGGSILGDKYEVPKTEPLTQLKYIEENCNLDIRVEKDTLPLYRDGALVENVVRSYSVVISPRY